MQITVYVVTVVVDVYITADREFGSIGKAGMGAAPGERLDRRGPHCLGTEIYQLSSGFFRILQSQLIKLLFPGPHIIVALICYIIFNHIEFGFMHKGAFLTQTGW